jgi:UDP-N-acetylglucosamine--N-acetylmuramyl-(pentapeptide) pyrophosphoryl-undecaprenol N-acetylglucosamine transferase
LRDAAKEKVDDDQMVLVLGGSQGSAFLNETVPQAHVRGVKFLHAVGRSNVGRLQGRVWPSEYETAAYLETNQLLHAYRSATVVVARSGGTLAEIAMFGLPSVLVPLPTSADNHQHHNAEEFVEMEAATLIPQSQASPNAVRNAITGWLDNPDRREKACERLIDWDVPDSTERIVGLIESAAKKKR